MGQAILKVDFVNKKLITEQQNNSDFYKNKHELCDGEVTMFTTSNSGGNWQMRMRVQGHRQELQSSYKLQNAPCKPLFLQGFFTTAEMLNC